ncbi:FtsK/SpoIIIE domain-containing protein [Cohnella terricola]|nr:FtsK/SpoIIIE domain-containing protein [Cohnella terricola]
MNNVNQNDRIRRERNRLKKAAYLRFITGVRQLSTIHRWKNVFVAIYLLVAAFAWAYRGKLLVGLDSAFSLLPILTIAVDWLVALFLLLGLLCLISTIGTPLKAKVFQDRLIRAGFTNHSHEPPLLLAKYKHPKNPKLTIWEFDENETSLSIWENKKDNIKGALIDTIINMKQSKNGRRIILCTVSPRSMLPPLLRWQDKYLSKESFELVLGESLIGRETVNLAKIPHILLGGSSGSGKSILLKLLLMQCVEMGAEVYIADFKGGVDFSAAWHKKCRMCFDESDLLDLLTSLTDELQRRKAAFREAECANIDEYNTATNTHLKRIIFACDEIAEILDKTGLSKERKELISQIESHLSVIARQGRAFGIHLIIATQRPSADILSGQIRSNIDFRICGRADNVLSQIILDSTEAAEQIPKDAQGRFITNTGLIFQSYLFDDNEVFSSGSRAIGG